MPSSHLIFCCPHLLLPLIPPSIRVLSNESTLRMKWPKIWSFSLSISPSNEHPGLVSFRMDWLDLLAVQGTLKSLLKHHSSKASILGCSAFFTVQCSHPYMTTGKTIALTRWTFVGKVISLLFNMLSRLVITFFPRSKHLLISWLQSPSTVILDLGSHKFPVWEINEMCSSREECSEAVNDSCFSLMIRNGICLSWNSFGLLALNAPPPTHPSWRILCPRRQDSLLEFKAFLTLPADLRVLQVGRERRSQYHVETRVTLGERILCAADKTGAWK